VRTVFRYHIVTTVLELLKMIRDYLKSGEAIPALLDQARQRTHAARTGCGMHRAASTMLLTAP
jgi:hypothetical protein